jgi:hypothetical protein
LASADEKLRSFFLDHAYLAVNKEIHEHSPVTPALIANDDLVNNVLASFNNEEEKTML